MSLVTHAEFPFQNAISQKEQRADDSLSSRNGRRFFETLVAKRSKDFGMTLAASNPIMARLSTNGGTVRSI